MSRREVVASAPSRIDLAGGTLDIWPLSVLVPRAITVNLAIDLRAEARVRARPDGRLCVVSRDRGRRVSRPLPLVSNGLRGPLALLLRLCAAFSPESGLDVETRATAPAGAGLGGSSTLGIAVAAALERWTGRPIGRRRLFRRVMNCETAELGVPTGTQDYLAALHGGLAAYHHELDGTRRDALPGAEALASRLVLAYTGQPRNSGASNWDMFRRFVDREPETMRRLAAIAAIACKLRDALARGDVDRAGRLVGDEGRLRVDLAPSVATPALRRAADAATAAGALGTKICGAGGGGCLVAVARAGRASRVAEAMAATGATILPVRVARSGVRVREVSARRAGSSPGSASGRRIRSR